MCFGKPPQTAHRSYLRIMRNVRNRSMAAQAWRMLPLSNPLGFSDHRHGRTSRRRWRKNLSLSKRTALEGR